MEPLNVWDYERLAAERLEPGAHGYYAGGAGDEVTLRDNVEAYPPLAASAARCSSTSASARRRRPCSAQEVSMPLLVAPVAFQRVAHPDGEVATRARGARRRDDHVPLDARDRDAGRGRRDRRRRAGSSSTSSATRASRASWSRRRATAASRALVLTVDAPVRGKRERDAAHGVHDPARHQRRVARPRRGDARRGVRADLAVADLARPRAASRREAACRCSSRAC